MLLAWASGHGDFFAQCANVGDSACVMKYVLVLSFLFYLLTVVTCSRTFTCVVGVLNSERYVRFYFSNAFSGVEFDR